MIYYIDQIKNWKNLGSWLRKCVIIDLIRNGLLILLSVGLYLLLNNTGLLIYIILMLKIHWSGESK